MHAMLFQKHISNTNCILEHHNDIILLTDDGRHLVLFALCILNFLQRLENDFVIGDNKLKQEQLNISGSAIAK